MSFKNFIQQGLTYVMLASLVELISSVYFNAW